MNQGLPVAPEAWSLTALGTLSALLTQQGLRIAVAESCTGGLLGAALTAVSGSSTYFAGGVIAYDDRLKSSLLGVPAVVISEHGAVSAEVARLMAAGVRRLLDVEIGLSVTGIAGPTGGSGQKPVGTTYVGFSMEGLEEVRHFCWDGDRELNRRNSVDAALRLAVDCLARSPELRSNV